MIKLKTPDEILEEQRTENTKAYANKIRFMQGTVNELEAKIKNMEATVAQAVSSKQKELDALAEEMRLKNIDIDNVKNDVQMSIRESEKRKQESQKMLDDVSAQVKQHQEAVEMHIRAAQEEKDNLAKRHAVCDEMEKLAVAKNEDAHARLKEAYEKENEVSALIEKFSAVKAEVENKSFDLDKKIEENRVIEESLNAKRKDLEVYNQGLVSRETQFKAHRDELDNALKMLEKRKSLLDEQESIVKRDEVKNALDSQRIQDAQKDLDLKISKLNDLKNNVETLMKSQGK